MAAVKALSLLAVTALAVDVVFGQEPCPGLTVLAWNRCPYERDSPELLACHRCLWAGVPANATQFWTESGCKNMKNHVSTVNVKCDAPSCPIAERTIVNHCMTASVQPQDKKGLCFSCVTENCNEKDSCANKLQCYRRNIATNRC